MKNHHFTRIIKVVAIFLALFFLSSLQGCMYYYKVQTVKRVTSKAMKNYYRMNKYLILCQGDSAWHLSYPRLSGEEIFGTLEVLPGIYKKFKTQAQRKGRYRNTERHDESYVIGQVYLYPLDSVSPKFHAGDSVRINFSAIQRAEDYKKDHGRTGASWGVPVVLGTVVGLPALIVIVMAISGSSPGISLGMGM